MQSITFAISHSFALLHLLEPRLARIAVVDQRDPKLVEAVRADMKEPPGCPPAVLRDAKSAEPTTHAFIGDDVAEQHVVRTLEAAGR